MKRLTICFALLTMMMAWALAGEAGAKAPGTQPAATVNLVGVDLTNPTGMVGSSYFGSDATVTGTSFLDNLVVTYVRFWVDLPASQIADPQPYGGCPTGSATCQFLGQDYQSPYGMGSSYNGPSGRHTATIQVWRDVWGDTQPVLLGQDSNAFCLNNCGG
jgi:hypothetical protein